MRKGPVNRPLHFADRNSAFAAEFGEHPEGIYSAMALFNLFKLLYEWFFLFQN